MRKKKKTRKYIPKNEFRINHSPRADGHPHFIFGETSTKYKSLGFTTTPKENVKHIRMEKNPQKGNNQTSYMQYNVHTARKSYYSKMPLSDWELSQEDRAIVRHRIKEYKKSTNKKPVGYYENKKKK